MAYYQRALVSLLQETATCFCLQPRPQLSTFVANSNSKRCAPNAHYNLQLADDLGELLLQVLKKYVSNRHYNLQQAVINL
jgi:hypothetical protein